jgi:transcriptional regulator with XRE-family HTH domain
MDRRGVDAIVGVNVRGRRAGLDMSQPDLAAKMGALGHGGWGAATVSRVESGKRATSTAELFGLGLILGATPEDLLDPTAYGDESDVAVGLPIKARDFRVIVRGEYRPRVHFTGKEPKNLRARSYELVPTDRVNVVERSAHLSADARLGRKR